VVTTQYLGEAEECDAVALVSEGRLVAVATPDELRRSATGGDVLQIETTTPIAADALSGLPIVRDVQQRGARSLLVTVDHAGTASPRIADAIEAAGAGVASSSEFRPSFDDVFATLVSRYRRNAAPEADNRPGTAEAPQQGRAA
jgi:ABC-2 type transport system ATP-binding protein